MSVTDVDPIWVVECSDGGSIWREEAATRAVAVAVMKERRASRYKLTCRLIRVWRYKRGYIAQAAFGHIGEVLDDVRNRVRACEDMARIGWRSVRPS